MHRCLIALVVAGCSGRAPLGSCDDDLRGVYAAERSIPPGKTSAPPAEPVGSPAPFARLRRSDERWMVLDHGSTLEAYPLFPDSADGAAEVGPRMIALERGAGASIEGALRRRYMQRAELCEARLPVHVTRCAGDALELVLADPAPPIGFAPCAWAGPGPSRVVRWRRD